MLPDLSTATHSDADGHDMPLMPLAPLIAFVVQVAVVPSAGSELVTALPPLSEATQNDVDGHEIATGNGIPKKPGWSIFLLTQVAAAPSPGSVVVSALPLTSTATHRSVSEDTHDTALIWVVPSMSSESHDVPPVVEVNAVPLPSTATHNAADVHDTPLNEVVPSTLDVSQ